MFRADVFRVALAELNTNQKALAKRLKISESTFTKIKHGMEPRVSLAMRIAKALNKTVYDLWEEPGE